MSGYIGQKMLTMEAEGKGSPRRGLVDVVMEDMKMVGVAKEEAGDRVRWRQIIYCCNHERVQMNEEEEEEENGEKEEEG